MLIIEGATLTFSFFFGFLVFLKFRREMKYEIRDNSLEIKRKKLENLYHNINP